MSLFPKVYDRKKREKELRKKWILRTNNKIGIENELIKNPHTRPQNKNKNKKKEENIEVETFQLGNNVVSSKYDKIIIVPYNHSLGIDNPQINKILIEADILGKLYTDAGYQVAIIPAYLVDYLKLLGISQKQTPQLIQTALYNERKKFYKHCLTIGIVFTIPRRNYFSYSLLHACNNTYTEAIKKGLVTSTYDVRYRSIGSQTALTDNDVQITMVKGSVFFIRFFMEGKKDVITATISTISFLFGAVAIAVNPNDKRYKKIIGRNLLIPIINKPIPIVGDNRIDATRHTGAVVLTPAHDRIHLNIAQANNLPTDIYAIDEHGFFTHHAGQFAYKNANTFTENIIRFLTDISNLDKIITEQIPQHASKTTGEILIPLAKRQRFFELPSTHVLSDINGHIIPIGEEERITNLLYGKKQNITSKIIGIKQKTHFDPTTRMAPSINTNQIDIEKSVNMFQKWCISKRIIGVPKLPSGVTQDGNSIVSRDIIVERYQQAREKIEKKQGKNIHMTLLCLALWAEGILPSYFTVTDLYSVLYYKQQQYVTEKTNDIFLFISTYLSIKGITEPARRSLLTDFLSRTTSHAEHICVAIDEAWGIKQRIEDNKYIIDWGILTNACCVYPPDDCFDSTWLAVLQTMTIIQQSIADKNISPDIHIITSASTEHFTTCLFQYHETCPCIKELFIHHVPETIYKISIPPITTRLQTTAADCVRASLLCSDILGKQESLGANEEFFIKKLWNATRYISSKINRGSVTPKQFSDLFVSNISLFSSDTLTRILTRRQKLLEERSYRYEKNEPTRWYDQLLPFLQYEFCDIFLEHIKGGLLEYIEETKKGVKNKKTSTNQIVTDPNTPISIITSYLIKQFLQALYPLMPYIASSLWIEGKCKENITVGAPYNLPEVVKKNFKYSLLMDISAQRRKRYTALAPRGQHCTLHIQGSKDFLSFVQTQESKLQILSKNTSIMYYTETQALPEALQESIQIVNITIGCHVDKTIENLLDVDPQILTDELEQKQHLLQKVRYILTALKPHEVLMKKEYEKQFITVKEDIERLEYEIKRIMSKK